jgi:isocitrate/isopropylmalate dehydrogenase
MRTIVVLEGDETGQELLEEALRVLAADVVGFELELPPLRPFPGEPPRD